MPPEVIRMAQIENIVTVVAAVAIVLGLYAMGAGSDALFGLLILVNCNTFKCRKPTP